MKKIILSCALITLASTQVQAETNTQPTQTQTDNAAVTAPENAAPANNVNPPAETTTPTTENQQPVTAETQQLTMPAVMNCEYKISPEVKQIDQNIVLAWAEKAIVQAFDFDSNSIDAQMLKLQNCFTDQGWQGFNNALQKSGNIEAIKTQKLTVSSLIDGKVQITDAKDSQWKLTVPLQVVYQNDKEKVTQQLNLDVTIGRKMSGDLGVMQIIAAPRQDDGNVPAPATNNPATQPAPAPATEPATTPEQNTTPSTTEQ